MAINRIGSGNADWSTSCANWRTHFPNENRNAPINTLTSVAVTYGDSAAGHCRKVTPSSGGTMIVDPATHLAVLALAH